jgi:hypothetical protein
MGTYTAQLYKAMVPLVPRATKLRLGSSRGGGLRAAGVRVEYRAATYILRVYDHTEVYGVAVLIVGIGMVEWEGITCG